MPESIDIKRANWLELFFDLVFVYAISKTTHVISIPLDGNIPVESYGLFVLILIPVWWAWTGHTLYTTRFDTEDDAHHFLSFAQMLAALFLASFISTSFEANYHGFLASYLVIRVLLIAMYLRAARLTPEAAPAAHALSAGFGVGLLVAGSSAVFDSPWRFVVLYFGIAIEIATPILLRKRLSAYPVNSHHLPERLGLLTIILLGESVVALGSAMEARGSTLATFAAAVIGFVYLAATWRVYFTLAERRPVGKELGHAQGMIYWHLPLYAALAVSANFVRFSLNPTLSPVAYTTMGIVGLALFLGALVAIHGFSAVKAAHARVALSTLVLAAALLVATGLFGRPDGGESAGIHSSNETPTDLHIPKRDLSAAQLVRIEPQWGLMQ